MKPYLAHRGFPVFSHSEPHSEPHTMPMSYTSIINIFSNQQDKHMYLINSLIHFWPVVLVDDDLNGLCYVVCIFLDTVDHEVVKGEGYNNPSKCQFVNANSTGDNGHPQHPQ